MNPNAKYRADIDGIRAIAVIAVLLFHAFPSTVPGGFVGVDVFFVISGFLITGILHAELRTDRFSIKNFYIRRIRRIFPALLAVLFASILLGWVLLLPGEFAQLGKHIVAAASFCVNLVLWNESGYFDNAAETKPLLHLWSLGVEEQFYIIWPIVLWLVFRRGRSLLWTTALILVGSFVLNIAQSISNNTADFYSPLTRFWELLIGGAIAIAWAQPAWTGSPAFLKFQRSERATSIMSVTGLFLIGASIVFVREEGFPGWQALFPVIGTALIIASGSRALPNRTVLSLRPVVYIGKISYPLYLWHWPLLSFARIYTQSVPSPALASLLLIASLLLSIATYHVIERPFRQKEFGRNAHVWLVSGMAALAITGLGIMQFNGLPERAVAKKNTDLSAGFDGGLPGNAEVCTFLTPEEGKLYACVIDTREEPRFAIFGDSKAASLYPGVFRTSEPGGRWLFVGSGKFGPLVTVLSDNPIYGYVNQEAVSSAIKTINSFPSIDTVVIATAARALFSLKNDSDIEDLPASPNFDIALKGLDEAVKALLAAGKDVMLVIDNPTLPPPEDCIARITGSDMLDRWLGQTRNSACAISVERQLELSAQYRKLLTTIAERHPGRVTLFDTIPLLCDQENRLCSMSMNGRPLYGYTDHISDYSGTMLGTEINGLLEERRQQSAAGSATE